MNLIPKGQWPRAFAEGKQVAELVLQLNKKLKKYVKRKEDDLPTDREIVLAACVEIFHAYRASQESTMAVRNQTLSKAEQFILEKMDSSDYRHYNLLRAVRKSKNADAGQGFLKMWEYVEAFLNNGVKEEFWKQFDTPTKAVHALIHDLGIVANIGEENGSEENKESNDSEGRPISSQGSENKTEQGTNPTSVEESGRPESSNPN